MRNIELFKIKIFNFFNSENSVAKSFFYLGIFLLPSTFSLALLSIIFALILRGFSFEQNKYLEDKYNLAFLLSALFMVLSCMINFYDDNAINNSSQNQFNSILGLLNWIPFFPAFWLLQPFLSNYNERKIISFLLISGTFPVIFSAFSQAFLGWHGPMETLYGLIIWYQRPLDSFTNVTGLFNNQNYLGAWLIVIWPFCLSLILFNGENIIRKYFHYIILFSVSFITLLTSSRSAWICLLFAIPIIFERRIKRLFLIFLFVIFLIILNINFPIFGENFQIFLKGIIPQGIWLKVTNYGINSLTPTRSDLWISAIRMISNNPLFGSGSTSFSTFFLEETGTWYGHSHNLLLELIISYGILASLCVILPVSNLIFNSYQRIFRNNNKINIHNIIDRAWVGSLILISLMHLVDIPYFDGRISLIAWILLAGSKKIIEESNLLVRE